MSETAEGITVEHGGSVVAQVSFCPAYVSAAAVEAALCRHYGVAGVTVEGNGAGEPSAEWASEVLERLAPSLWCRVRWFLEGQERGSFEQFLELLRQPIPFGDIFCSLYARYRRYEGISAGHSAVAWDILGAVSGSIVPEYDFWSDLGEDLKAYAATLRQDWSEPGMDVGVLADWEEIRHACEWFLGAEGEEKPILATALYFLVREFR